MSRSAPAPDWHLTDLAPCPATGAPCGPGLRLLARLGAAMDLAGAIAPALAVSGSATADCPQPGCCLSWTAGARQLRATGMGGGAGMMLHLSRSH